MKKNVEKVVNNTLLPYLKEQDKDANFEYQLVGDITPAYRYMLTLASIIAVLVIIPTQIYQISWVYALVVIMFAFFVVLQLLYVDVYIAKFGKKMFVCRKAFLRKDVIEILPFSSFNFLEEGSDSNHVSIEMKYDGKKDRVVFRYTNQSSSINQSIDQFVEDINRKKK